MDVPHARIIFFWNPGAERIGLAAIMRDVTRRFEEMRALKRQVAAAAKAAP